MNAIGTRHSVHGRGCKDFERDKQCERDAVPEVKDRGSEKVSLIDMGFAAGYIGPERCFFSAESRYHRRP